jgi:hypothetical protein
VRKYLGLALTLSVWLTISTASARGADEPKLPTAEITVHRTAHVGWGDGGDFYVAVFALWPPPRDPTTLVDTSGTNVATVTSAPGQCREEPRRTGLGPVEWCLKVSGLAAGSDVVGTLTTSQMSLKLTVGTRHNFVWGPLAITIASFLVALFISWWTTMDLGRRIANKRVDAELKKNESDSLILGLDTWVGEQKETQQDSVILPIILAVRRSGPREAGRARARLGEAESSSPLPEGHEVRANARIEAARDDHKMEDFYSGPTKRDRHPADAKVELLNRAHLIWQKLRRAEDLVGKLPAGSQPGLRQLLRNAHDILAQAKDDSGLTFADEAESELWRKLDDVIALERHPALEAALDVEERPKGGDLTVDALDREVLPLPLPRLIPRIDMVPVLPLIEAGFLTVATVVVLALIAALSVASANWVPNATFGTWSNYLALAVSAFASTAAAGILAVLVLWRTAAPEKK